MTLFGDKPWFIFEMANNHMGSVEHGARIVREIHEATRGFDFHFAFKLQYRHLDSFIHPAYKDRTDVKYVKRFMETRLSESEFQWLVEEMRSHGFTVICTPFDEPSVDLIERQGIEVLKVASCSFTDWPLLERLVRSDKPIIASTAGATLDEIDKVVSFFEHRNKEFALMHCVGEYPTRDEHLELNQIDLMRARYPQVPIGFSTHERPDNTDVVMLAVAKGARLFEKHVGVPTEEWPLNDYSANPEQVRAWLGAAERAYTMGGVVGRRSEASAAELASLRSLRRGVFAREAIRAGEVINSAQVFFAFPPCEGQLSANDWSKYSRFTAIADIAADAPLTRECVAPVDLRQDVYGIVQRVKGLLKKGHVVVPGAAELEISHHYGIDRFEEFGITLITVVNREYCKKLIVMLPGQTHPEQYHLKKEETFHVLYGEVVITLDGVERTCRAGDVLTVPVGVRHIFYTANGAVFEEISSTHYTDDSYYTDESIGANKHRKTWLRYWMR